MAEDFYEDDEPVEDVIAAFGAGPHGVTAPPRRVQRWVHDASFGATSFGVTLDSCCIVGTPTFAGQRMRPVP